MPQRSQLLQSWAPLLCKMVVQPPSSYQQRVKAQHLSGNVTRLDPSASATCGTKNGNVISTGQAKYRCRTGTKGSALGMKSRQLPGSQRIQPEAVATRTVPSHLGCNPHVWQELTRTALNQPLAWKMPLANPVTG
ncbi:uncharacterized protein [Callorhinus ursinus]|uniref:Glutaredoxin-1 isoform X2 n=1 Tax=Callorhinus ursinus TaxID=34884 RepID=A0A3Q7Q2S3_CALUR|nr:glutaredoxin-1 isoform X2 [Callorhinus ursinus]